MRSRSCCQAAGGGSGGGVGAAPGPLQGPRLLEYALRYLLRSRQQDWLHRAGRQAAARAPVLLLVFRGSPRFRRPTQNSLGAHAPFQAPFGPVHNFRRDAAMRWQGAGLNRDRSAAPMSAP